ncbi:hypothetical protein [Alcaligenes sp. WGS1538]|uniref:DUF4376 domain-containing protein n=1 Tax=Alcaligenes sp. WGS1538 TaxID=3366811 RepID=UPI00372D5ADA
MQIKIDTARLVTAAAQLQARKDKKVAALSAECRKMILVGFKSEALGVSHWYPSQETDQLNLAASVTDSLLPNLPADWTTSFWCADAAGHWALRPHTAGQIQRVGREAKARVLRLMEHNAWLAERVARAPDEDAVDEIAWSEPAA